jgi:hypothetical protein
LPLRFLAVKSSFTGESKMLGQALGVNPPNKTAGKLD